MTSSTANEEILDVSQSINRCRHVKDVAPCITPGCRLWLRNRCRWMLAPEAVICQGFSIPEKLKEYTHRQIVDLVGNAFHCDSLLVSFAVALASAPVDNLLAASAAPADTHSAAGPVASGAADDPLDSLDDSLVDRALDESLVSQLLGPARE
eukprot:4015053-Amphidinium_carterae.1